MTVATLMCAPSVRSGRWSTDDGACEPVLNAVLLAGTSEDMADPSHRTAFVTLNELHAVVVTIMWILQGAVLISTRRKAVAASVVARR